MKTRAIALLTAIVLSALVVIGLGAYIKYEMLMPYGIAQDKSMIELPFLLMTDEALRYEIRLVMEEKQAQEPSATQPVTVPTTEPAVEQTEEPATEPTADSASDAVNEATAEQHTHTYENSSVVPATCVTEGYTLHFCSVCGESYQDSWTATVAHSYDTAVIEPTPEADGYTEYTCTVCGDSYRDHYIAYVPPYTGPEPVIAETYPGYDFSYGAVSDAWYEDVLFVGDSRTLGMRDYHRSGNADYFCAVGMNVFNIQTNRCADINFEKQTLESLLSRKSYGKVFVNLGINECGYPTNSLLSAFKDLIALIRKYQPDTKIILQGIMTVSRNYSDASYFQPDHISYLNDLIRELSNGTDIYFIDVNPYFTDPDGYLYGELTWDGCHLYASYYGAWAQWVSFAVGQLGIS